MKKMAIILKVSHDISQTKVTNSLETDSVGL